MKHESYKSQQTNYSIGYIISALLCIGIYVIATLGAWPTKTILIVALIAAAVQTLVQSYFFLHLKRKGPMGWHLITYLVAWAMLLIIVVGSLWVVSNMNYNMGMDPEQMLQKIKIENSKGF